MSSPTNRLVELLSSNVEKPELDDRSYRLIKLCENKLEVLLVNDPTTEKSSAAMDVHVGSINDPKDFPGLAHALEHCLFLGFCPVQARLIPFQALKNILRKTIIINFWLSTVAVQMPIPVSFFKAWFDE
jgi:Insulinase (Peptidase family M16)